MLFLHNHAVQHFRWHVWCQKPPFQKGFLSMLVHVDTESWQSEMNLITLLSETKTTFKKTKN
ncbi:hypothetical protein EVA_20802 [gut metagenome]|uniref:Uncharacterized protein n=1 Tax=gut metagenome TaxID=749906 RepID=J9FUT0_9ZZZZ